MFIKVKPIFEFPHEDQSSMIPPEILLTGYRHGIFPMALSDEGTNEWFSADPRGIIDLNDFKVPRRLARTIRKEIFDIKVNSNFEKVIRHCALKEDTWISESIIQSYLNLHSLGHAHCVETWKDGKLAGGIYGVALGSAFFGESMFHRVSDASKVALVYLVKRLKFRGYKLFDIQMVTPLTERFGGKLISGRDYLRRLNTALKDKCRF